MISLMIQGTASHVGKTMLVLGICRFLYKKGIKVCPFKPQNITSNIFKLDNNDPIGYAQYLQAKACNITPDIRMNPILIDIGKDTNFIIKGQSIREEFHNYDKLLPFMKETITEAYISLSKEFDVIIIEGAGSPTEINRHNDDISNMWFANYFKIPVVLISSMEYGGCFASVVGTFELLNQQYMSLVRGFVLNKYDGDKRLLDKGIKYIENRYQKKFLGSIPYITNLEIPEEDCLRFGKREQSFDIPANDKFINSADILANSIFNNIDLSFLYI